MGRTTQLIDFLNREIIPNSEERQTFYTHISINDELVDKRKKYRKELKKQTVEDDLVQRNGLLIHPNTAKELDELINEN